MSSINTTPAFLSDSNDALDNGDVFGRESRKNTTWVVA